MYKTMQTEPACLGLHWTQVNLQLIKLRALQQWVTVVVSNRPFVWGVYCHRMSLEAHFLFPESNMGYDIRVGDEDVYN